MVNMSCVTVNWSSLEYFLFAFQFQIYIFDIQLQVHKTTFLPKFQHRKYSIYLKKQSSTRNILHFVYIIVINLKYFVFFSSFNANVIISHVYVIRLLASPDIPCLRHGSILPPFLVCTYSWSKTSVVIDIHIRIYIRIDI